MILRRRLNQRGLTLVEIMVVMIIFAFVSLSVTRGIVVFSKQTGHSSDKSFAIQKSIQMMEELRSLVTTSGSDVSTLDDYDDGATHNFILTTNPDITAPGTTTSDNPNSKYYRNISVIQLPNEGLARRIYIRVYRTSDDELLAETMSILRTIRNDYLPTQVMDLYVLAIENIPGWWVSLSTMKPMLDNILQDLETRNPGLEIRTHWITQTAYGRDPYYRPYLNQATYTNTTASPWVYFYPGKMLKGTDDFYYFVPSSFSGRHSLDGTLTHSTSYSIADQYNNAVRYPEEEALYAQAVAAAAAAGAPKPEWSLRMFLEKMNTSTSETKNALVINLHGELLPMPPMRNYSDAAKEPTLYPKIRVVSHTGKLQYASGSGVMLRVYPYATDPDTVATSTVISTTTIYLPNVNIASGLISVRQLTGSDTVDYAWSTATLGTHYAVSSSASGTRIDLWNTPVRHPKNNTTNRGLPSAYRLHALEYIPCEVGNPGSPEHPEGVRDLSQNNATIPKNTARWVINFTAGAFGNNRYTIETRIGTDLTTGTSANQPTNLSRTYVWVGQTPPLTEQYQFIGDPRHMPYSDVKANHGYNWYFTSINSGDYPGFTKATAGWDGATNIDNPRFYEILRKGLLASTGIWNSITGWSSYYIGIGNEMGDDGNLGFAGGLPIVETPWAPASTTQRGIDEITSGGFHGRSRLISNTANTWYAKPWIGELYPDSAYVSWQTNGNLPTGSGNYYRANYTTYAAFSFNPVKRVGEKGAPSVMNGNSSGSGSNIFSHAFADGETGALQTAGTYLSQTFNFPIIATINAPRAFSISSNLAYNPPEWNDVTFSGQRTTLSLIEPYFNSTYSASFRSSALVSMALGSDRAYWVYNGLATQGNFGSSDIGKLCVTSLLRSFLSLGGPSITTGRIAQLPLIQITSPQITDQFLNPSTIAVSWNLQWRRWDGQGYTEAYAPTFTETTTIYYHLKYSNDNGRTWSFIQDGTPAEEGVYDSSKQMTVTSYSWNVSALPRGNYILRLEAYRNGQPLHYSYQQRAVYIFR